MLNKEGEFLKEELSLRKKFGWPPYVQIIKLTFSHKDNHQGQEETKLVLEKLRRAKEDKISLFGPLPSKSPGRGGKYSWNIIMKAKLSLGIKKRNQLLSLVPSRWEVDVDPLSIL